MDDRTKPEPPHQREVGFAMMLMPRITCVGCAEYLLERGLLEVVMESPMPVMNKPKGSVVCRTYRIASGYTVDDCQNAVRHRHRGRNPWPD